MSSPNTQTMIEEAFEKARIAGLPPVVFEQMTAYADLLMRWNTRLNLTALRTPSEIIRRHLVECAVLAQRLPSNVVTLMDYGSGAGLPGMVVAICRPEIKVTLAEAHGKKATFLREVMRSLSLEYEVYEGRVETMPLDRTFHAVSMRAVEKMELAIPIAFRHVERYLVLLTTDTLAKAYRGQFAEMDWKEDFHFPESDHMVLAMAVPRGTRRFENAP